MDFSYIAAVLVCLLPAGVFGFGSGAGGGACLTMTPGHIGLSKQTTPTPYQVTLNVTTLVKDAPIQVSISGKSNENFQGFLVQARNTGGTIVDGVFSTIGSDTTTKTMNCAGATSNSMTHTAPTNKTTVSFIWTPPANLDVTKELLFRATVAQQKAIWWEDTLSATIKGGSSAGSPGLALMLVVFTFISHMI